ncbi:MAG TPA: ECF-type sigma factor [Gemmatimonadales bacterium]|nr:ECF-type sigma factor [Gemmatimonadales bacterium]
MSPAPSDISDLLRRWGAGDSEALDRLIPVLYDRLRQLAHQRLRAEPGECSLDTTGLVHEAYLRLVNSPNPDVRDHGHFLTLASRVMRHLLVDHARARKAAKRGGGAPSVDLDPMMRISQTSIDAFADLDEALKRLEAMDARQGQILELRYFGGLSLEETASALGISLATVKRDLRSARAWLATELRGGEPAV